MNSAEAMANASFKKDRDGNTVFFPWGALGRGRTPPSAADETAAREFMANSHTNMQIMMWICIAVSAFGWQWALLLMLISCAWYASLLMSLVSGWPYHEDRFSQKHAYVAMAAGYSKRKLWWHLIILLTMLPLGLYGLYIGEWLSGLALLVLGGGGVVVYKHLLRIKSQ